jgi:NarL family two-component system response regulator LiaR
MSMVQSTITSKLVEKDRLTILIVDDHPLVRDAIKSHLEKQADFRVVGEAADGEEAVRIAKELAPDVVIMDICLPRIDGLEATRRIKAANPDICILVLSMIDNSDQVLKILDAGASGYLTKSIFGEEISKAIRSVIAGESIIPEKILHSVLKKAMKQSSRRSPSISDGLLTPRELEILRMAAAGMSNKNIAQTLNLSARTVKGYCAEIFSKLNVNSRTGAVITAMRAGLFTVDDISPEINKYNEIYSNDKYPE